MNDHTQIKLVSSEMASLWKTYMSETLNKCVLQHFLITVEDNDIRSVVQAKLMAKEQRILKMKDIFKQENFPVPLGFTDQDINLQAPRLFTDTFIAHYVHLMARMGMDNYGQCVSITPRTDLRTFFIEGLNSFTQIQNQIMDILLEKGLYVRSPYIPYPKQVDFVKEQNFLNGWFGERKPLTALQITHMSLNTQKNAIGEQLLTAFSQTAKSKEIRELMIRGKRISSKLMEIFSSLLKEDDVIPSTYGGIGVTNSTDSPFSDKLMLSLTMNLNVYAITLYATSLSESTRRDLFTHYTRIIAEVGKYGEDTVKLAIKFGYLEEPPKATDRNELAKV